MRQASSVGIPLGWGVFAPLALAVLLLSGCGPSQKEMMAKDQMERARAKYADAKADPEVEALAPIPMAEAGKALQAAEAASKAEDRIHLGYLAEKRTQIAVTLAEGKKAEKDTERLSRETAEIIAQKREREAKAAQAEAERARQEAEKARLAAQAEAERAERARHEVEQARLAAQEESQRAEQAKREADRARQAAQAEAEKAARAKAEADQLMRELAELKARPTERGIVLTIGDVLFATGKSDLSAAANRNVEKLSEFLKGHPNRNVLVEGHTDNVGGDEYNRELSENRAASVKEKLVADGVGPERITTVGYGKKYPIETNDTAEGRAQNRRVEVVILNEGVAADTQFRR